MGFREGNFVFGLPALTNDTTPTVSTNVYDAGAAILLFAAPQAGELCFRIAVTADANPSIRVDLRGADNAALTTNPVIIASSGVVASNSSGEALASGEIVDLVIPVGNQAVAKRYYGLFVTLGGTNPDIAAAAQQGYVSLAGQTNLRGARAAVPA
jgi:hypothetical protein